MTGARRFNRWYNRLEDSQRFLIAMALIMPFPLIMIAGHPIIGLAWGGALLWLRWPKYW